MRTSNNIKSVKGLRIGFDLDGVITHPSYITKVIREHFNLVDFRYEDIIYYDLGKVLGKTSEEMSHFFSKSHDKLIMENVLNENIVELINDLKDNNELYIITARHDSAIEDTLLWLRLNEVNILEDNMYFIGSHSKAEKVKELKLDVFIEDRLETLQSINYSKTEEENENYKPLTKILFNTPYNKFDYHKDEDNNIFRVDNLNEVYDILKRIK